MEHHCTSFIYGRSLRGAECVSREAELRTVFNRLRNGESTAIIGEPHAGKTSFLTQLTDRAVQAEYFDGAERKLVPAFLDCLSCSPTDTPQILWAKTLTHLDTLEDIELALLLDRAKQSSYATASLEELFLKLAQKKILFVLLLDEFECLLKHKNFSDPAFYGFLRYLGSLTDGLALVITSRLSVAKLNRLGAELLDLGSPFFNFMIDIKLPPFRDPEIEFLLGRAEPHFSPIEKAFIQHSAGRNPFLLQAMAAALCEAPPSQDRVEKAAERFHKTVVAQHFVALWDHMDDDTRTVSIILCLQDIGGQALGSTFNFGEIERADRYGPELRKLADLGLAERIEQAQGHIIWDKKSLLVWHNEHWGLSCAAFSWWITEEIVTGTRPIATYQDWMQRKKYVGFLTQEQLDIAQNLIGQLSVDLLPRLARSLWDEIIKAIHND